ncbi:hypothetical protein CVT26_009314 [Gymnopilus dilepis]|uniref:Thyroglobulin type-1 domain-containing protein n=1 Tax=Gymnopilus dilepis TaxID=231916 RepID=A0A409YA40_9AGAR|nr:hypothetical protein CVT26_009314 [Gymnopilus dilepis]
MLLWNLLLLLCSIHLTTALNNTVTASDLQTKQHCTHGHWKEEHKCACGSVSRLQHVDGKKNLPSWDCCDSLTDAEERRTAPVRGKHLDPIYKQRCDNRGLLSRHPPKCPCDMVPRVNKKGHWDCCYNLTSDEQVRTDEAKQKAFHLREIETDHGRCTGLEAVLAPIDCTSTEFPLVRVRKAHLWDCCKSLTKKEEGHLQFVQESIKKQCRGSVYYISEDGLYIPKERCPVGLYAKKDTHWWDCCPELTDEEKKIGNEQRAEAERQLRDRHKELERVRADDEARREQRKKDMAACESAHSWPRLK